MSKSISQLRGNQMISEAKEPASPDEKDMALRQANFILDFAEDLVEHLEDDGDFPEWMQNKLSAIHEKAKDLYASIEGSYDDEDEDEDEEDMKESYSLKEEVTFQVDVDGLPTMYVKAKSPSEVKASLRKIVKQPGMIQNVTRIPDAEVKKIFRDKAQGKEEVEEGAKGYKPGWMLKADPKLGAAVKAKQDLNKKRQATYGNPSAGKSVKEEVAEAKTPSDVALHKTLGPTKNMQQGVEALKKKHGMSDDEAKKHVRRLMGMKEEVEQVDEAMKFSDKQIKMAYGIINDPRYKGGNMTAIVKKIEQIARGLSKHDGVQKAIQATNESTAAYGKSLEKEKEKRLTPSDRNKLSKIRAMLDKEKKK